MADVIAAGWLLHPLSTHGASFYGGIGGDVGELSIIAALVTIIVGLYRHHACHVDDCRRIGHNDPAVHAPACHRHHSLAHLRGRSHAHPKETL